METKLVGRFGEPRDYQNTTLNIRSYYGDTIANDEIRVFAIMIPGGPEIREYFYTYNIIKDSRFLFMSGDMSFHRKNRCIYSINGLNAMLRDIGLPAGSNIPWDKYQNTLITAQGIHANIQNTKFVCLA
jgi:hypothetical protein